jgi:hypothetical protein
MPIVGSLGFRTEPRVEGGGLLEGGDGQVEVVEVVAVIAEVAEGFGAMGVGLDSVLEAGDGFVEAAFAGQGDALLVELDGLGACGGCGDRLNNCFTHMV